MIALPEQGEACELAGVTRKQLGLPFSACTFVFVRIEFMSLHVHLGVVSGICPPHPRPCVRIRAAVPVRFVRDF